MSIPVEKLARDGARFVLATSFSLRNFNELNRGCRSLEFDNLRLEGPAGVRLVDDFETTDGWEPRTKNFAEVTTSSDKTQGAAANKIAWAASPARNSAAHFRIPSPNRSPRTSTLTSSST